MTSSVKIIDSTLREGEQAPGVQFSLDQKKRIIDGLAAVGVSEVELGISSILMSCLGPLVRYCREMHPALSLSLWSRCRSEDIRHGASVRPDVLALSLPVSDILLEKKLARSRSWAVRTLRQSIGEALQLGLTVSVGFEDATRADPVFLAFIARQACDAGAARLRFADTLGIASPSSIARLFSEMSKLLPCELAVHAHNDFGMATANSIAALEAGALWADAAVLGLGERSGSARLEELAGYLALAGDNSTIKPQHLRALAELVASIAGRTIEPQHPVIGSDIFVCETGLHLHGLQLDPQTYEPYAPERVGAQRRLLFGAKSGRNAIRCRLAAAGLNHEPISDSQMLLVRETAQRLRRPLTETELLALLPRQYSDP